MNMRAVAAGLGFIAVTAALAWSPVRDLDLAVRDAADAYRPAFAESMAVWVNRLGSGGWLAIAALILALAVVVRQRDPRPLIPVAAAFLLTGVALVPLKWLLHRAPPHSPLPDDVEVRLFSQPGAESYPSGHAVNAIVWYGVIAALLATTGLANRALRWAPPVLVTLAGTYLGFHWLTDMLAGLCLGIVVDAAVRTTTRLRRAEPQPQPA
jgi:membrane-associated phospholipid phosphatase